MREIDIERMKRVLKRMDPNRRPATQHAGRPPEPPRRDPECELLRREGELQGALRDAAVRSGECRRALQGVYRRSEIRSRRLRADCFLRRGTMPGRGSGGRRGVLSALREAHRLLVSLAEAYENAAADMPRQREQEGLNGYARECRSDADTLRRLVDRAMG